MYPTLSIHWLFHGFSLIFFLILWTWYFDLKMRNTNKNNEKGGKRSNFEIFERKDLSHSIPGGSMIKNLPASAEDWVQSLTQEDWRKGRPTPVSLPGKFHRQRSLPACSAQGHKESDSAKWLSALEKESIPKTSCRELDTTERLRIFIKLKLSRWKIKRKILCHDYLLKLYVVSLLFPFFLQKGTKNALSLAVQVRTADFRSHKTRRCFSKS